MPFPVDDWQFWVVVGFFLGAVYLVIRRIFPTGGGSGCGCGCNTRKKKKKVQLTIEGDGRNRKR